MNSFAIRAFHDRTHGRTPGKAKSLLIKAHSSRYVGDRKHCRYGAILLLVEWINAAARAIQCLVEGCSIRSTERLTGLNRNTIMRLLIVAGERSAHTMNTRMRNLRPRYNNWAL